MRDLLLAGCYDFKTSIMKPVVCVFVDGPVQGSHKLYEKRGLPPKVGEWLQTEMMLEFVCVMQRMSLFSLLFWVVVLQETCVGAIGTEKSVFYQTFEP
jgi:hypothetical protein